MPSRGMLQGRYYRETDTLAVWTGEKAATGASASIPSLVLFLKADGGRAVVGFDLLAGGWAVVERRMGYDAGSDTLTLGAWAADPAWRSVNGDLIASWHEEDGVLEPIGVTVLNATANLARLTVV